MKLEHFKRGRYATGLNYLKRFRKLQRIRLSNGPARFLMRLVAPTMRRNPQDSLGHTRLLTCARRIHAAVSVLQDVTGARVEQGNRQINESKVKILPLAHTYIHAFKTLIRVGSAVHRSCEVSNTGRPPTSQLIMSRPDSLQQLVLPQEAVAWFNQAHPLLQREILKVVQSLLQNCIGGDSSALRK
jgi:hypothetical protein